MEECYREDEEMLLFIILMNKAKKNTPDLMYNDNEPLHNANEV